MALAFIIVLILYLIRFLSKKNQSWFGSRSIRVIGGVGLAPNKSLQMIEIGSSIYLVGVGEEIRLIDKVSDPEEVERIMAALEQEATLQRTPLAPLLAKLGDKLRRKSHDQPEEADDDISFHELFESKLRQMPSRKDKLDKLRNEDNTTDRSGDA
ncbi:flagellar biosynthetic protein FliO [Paenibacillus sp. P96]|uniref:Flagellar biosynthetic protein FliO n=1 Tax=Paenibacillus zeirhizosphaerae TaxID=2987519 RepID=A0ABT9FS33_9BACL|nr:flagellar biosynthetic protein FliO [Paenibacillus sp. P96]MDP4097531.1 flagellar biosynthetic protein FliO [Paenibacillus sp. P96]